VDAPEEGDAVGVLAREVGRVADRLRSMSDARLGQPFPPAGTRAMAALDLAQHLADVAQGVEDRGAASMPTPRVVPDVGVFALGDQVAVTGTDLVAAAAGLRPEEEVWTARGRLSLAQVVAEATDAVRALRQAL
jgi:hypothetical protein